MNKPSSPVKLKRRGLVLILSSPSGAGKSTLAGRLLADEPELEMSISVTTRAMRPGEVDGEHYHFISREEFDRLQANDELLESATVFGNSYGTPRKAVEDWLAAGRDVLFDIDWQGTRQVEARIGADLVRVFILPPSADELHDRLFRRAQDPPSVIAKRMAEASSEISHWPEYDYVVINDDIERCSAELKAILTAERLRRTRRTGLAEFVTDMMEKL